MTQEIGIKATNEPTADQAGFGTGLGILVEDSTNQRLIESLSLQLDLVPSLLNLVSPGATNFQSFEMIITDEKFAKQIRSALRTEEAQADGLNPAIIVVRSRSTESSDRGRAGDGEQHDGVLILPQDPAAALAQLSLFLYAHRAFARRYQSALDELHLNRRIFRSVTNGITVADATLPDVPLTYVNPAFEVMTGYSLEDVQGKNCRFLQGGETQQPGLSLIREAMKEQREVVAVIKNFRKDGSPFWNELSISPIRNRDGELTHFVGIQMDVTARVEFEAALRESEKLAAVGRLAASIAHEINNPLESVMNLLYLAEHSNGIDETRSFLGQADKELQRVALITSQSLRFYKQSTNPQAIRASELLHSVVDLYQSKLDSAHVTVEWRERRTQSIMCLESEIRQVLSNLIRNAIDAMYGTGGKLRIRTREATNTRSGLCGVLITIADTGSGISRDTMKQLGKAFFTTKGINGTGLGLWVSTEIIVRHGGRLRVRSSQEKGNSWTVFQLFLPYQGLTP
ncbi:two-component system sensor histidine kinase NtrB [Granulicella arctica]|uniref:two-component system sensor histidine kinase NtrB n=1 Tax=Granulicella arctica TaxID=940613 RepID=UPI0021E08309|nr:ATP-binding protein [Granulicella arctica]